MKLPSLQQLTESALNTFRRFPLVILDAVLGTVAALILVDREGVPEASLWFPILLAAILGAPLLAALSLTAEKKRYRFIPSLLLQLVGVVLLVLYALIVPQNLPNEPAVHMIRFLILAIAVHLFVAVAPFLSAGQLNGFWHYNKSLFLRILTSALYSAVLYAGLAIALAALDNLFGVDVPGKRYFELWIVIVGLFNTWFFLAGVPDDLEQLESLTEFPHGLKVFAQYILFPLVGVYVVILYAYLGKILISWDWPVGWVSKLILGFAAAGIFSTLVIYPIAEKIENTWMRVASRWFTLVLFPQVVLLFLALWRRVSEYGWTEGRYLAVVLGIWLSAYIIYFTLSKTKNIKLIPLSLCVVALFVGFGPWGVFSVVRTSQVEQLELLLIRTSILVDGTITSRHDSVSVEDSKRISSLLAYLHDFHGWGGISKWFPTESGGTQELAFSEGPAEVAKRMGVKYMRFWQVGPGGVLFLSSDRDQAVDIGGFGRAVRGRRIDANDKAYSSDEFAYKAGTGLDIITFFALRNGKGVDSVEIDVRKLADELVKEYGQVSTDRISPERMSLSAQGRLLRIKICLTFVRVQRRGEGVEIVAYDGDVYYAVGEGG